MSFNERRKSGDETNNIHSTSGDKYQHHFGEYSTLRVGNRKITYSLSKKSPLREEVLPPSSNQEESFGSSEILLNQNQDDQENSFHSFEPMIIDDQDEDSFDSTDQKSIRIFNELGNISPDTFSEPNDYTEFIIENNDHIIDLTDDNIILSYDNDKENQNENVAHSTNNNEIIDKDIIDFVEKNQGDNDDTSYDMKRLWKEEEMLNQVKNCSKKIFMSVQEFKSVQKKIITETSLVEDEIMGVHMAPNISINANLNELESLKNVSDDNNNQEQTTRATHTLPVVPVPTPKFGVKNMQKTSTISTSSSEINLILQKQIVLSENDTRKKKENARILKILEEQKLVDENTKNLMKNQATQNCKKTERKRTIITELGMKHDEKNNSHKRSKPSETVTKSHIPVLSNQNILGRKSASHYSRVESKSIEVQPRLLSNQCKIQPDKNKITRKLSISERRSSIQVGGIEEKDQPIVKKSNETKEGKFMKVDQNLTKKSIASENVRLSIQVNGSDKKDQKVNEKKDQNVTEKKISHSESKSRKHDSSKKNIDKYSKKDNSSSYPKKSTKSLPPDELEATLKNECITGKSCIVQLERRDDVENCLKRQVSREIDKNKKRKSEHSDKNKIDKSKKHREYSHKSSNHYKSSHSSSKSKTITMENKITNGLNELAEQLKNNANRHYKTKQSDDNPLKMKIRKIHEESTNQTREISSTSELIHKKPWDDNLRTSKYSWVNNNLIQNEDDDDIEERLALLEKGDNLMDNNVTISVERMENDSMSSLPDVVSTINGIEPCVDQIIISSSEVTTSCATPPVINNEELTDCLTSNTLSPDQTNMIQNHVKITDNQKSNFEQQITQVIEQNITGIVQSSENERIILVNPELEPKTFEIENHGESIETMDITIEKVEVQTASIAKIADTQIEHNSGIGITIKNEPEIPIIDLTYNEFIKKEELPECEIIEIEDDIPMLRVKASVFLSQEANDIVEKIKTCMSYTCSDVRTFDERIGELKNRIDKSREEVLKTEHIAVRARAIEPILATHLHYFNDVNMFKALTQAINDSTKKQFSINDVENVFQLLLGQSSELRKEFLGYKDNIVSDPNVVHSRPPSANNQVNEQVNESITQNVEQNSKIHNPLTTSSSNIIYNASNNLEEPLQDNNTIISNHTSNNILNNNTMAHSNTIRNDNCHDRNYLINSSSQSQSNGYYNPQSAQVYNGYQVHSSNIQLQNNNLNKSPSYNEGRTQFLNQNSYNVYAQNYYNWTHQRNQALSAQNYSVNMFTPMNLSYAAAVVPTQHQSIQSRQELQHQTQIQNQSQLQCQQTLPKQPVLQNYHQFQKQNNQEQMQQFQKTQQQLLHPRKIQELQKQQQLSNNQQWYQQKTLQSHTQPSQQQHLRNQQDHQVGQQEQQLVAKKKQAPKQIKQNNLPEPSSLISTGTSNLPNQSPTDMSMATTELIRQLLTTNQSDAAINQPRQMLNFKDTNLLPTSYATSNVLVPNSCAAKKKQDISQSALNSQITVNSDINGRQSVVRNRNTQTTNVPDLRISSSSSNSNSNIIWANPRSNCNMIFTSSEYSNNPA